VAPSSAICAVVTVASDDAPAAPMLLIRARRVTTLKVRSPLGLDVPGWKEVRTSGPHIGQSGVPRLVPWAAAYDPGRSTTFLMVRSSFAQPQRRAVPGSAHPLTACSLQLITGATRRTLHLATWTDSPMFVYQENRMA
jgi:hypothetical protein